MPELSSPQKYEIEIKSLLGDKTNAQKLKAQLSAWQPPALLTNVSSQLNHYFVGQNFKQLARAVAPKFDSSDSLRLERLLASSQNESVRTRQHNDLIIFVVKATVDDTSSSNGTARLEYEAIFPGTLDELDQLILDNGYNYQAKWSRYREEFTLTPTINVMIDRNAGYGHLVEFETIVHDLAQVDLAKEELRKLMAEFNLEELSQERLERMFNFYNEHWQDYYGTERTFIIE